MYKHQAPMANMGTLQQQLAPQPQHSSSYPPAHGLPPPPGPPQPHLYYAHPSPYSIPGASGARYSSGGLSWRLSALASTTLRSKSKELRKKVDGEIALNKELQPQKCCTLDPEEEVSLAHPSPYSTPSASRAYSSGDPSRGLSASTTLRYKSKELRKIALNKESQPQKCCTLDPEEEVSLAHPDSESESSFEDPNDSDFVCDRVSKSSCLSSKRKKRLHKVSVGAKRRKPACSISEKVLGGISDIYYCPSRPTERQGLSLTAQNQSEPNLLLGISDKPIAESDSRCENWYGREEFFTSVSDVKGLQSGRKELGASCTGSPKSRLEKYNTGKVGLCGGGLGLNRFAQIRGHTRTGNSPEAPRIKDEIPETEEIMAPGYRNTNSRRTGRGHVDHDVFEGLPVRQWRRDTVYVAPPPAQDGLDNAQDKWDVELPWGMPKDSHLLPQHAQDLLRAARSGRIYKRSLPVEEEVDDVDGLLGDKPEKKEETNKEKGFAARAWKQIPRHMEAPEIEYLAKRRKGLQTASQVTATTNAAVTMTRTTVKRTDAAGNVYQEVLVVPQGQAVDGEIVTQVPVVEPGAASSASAAVAHPARIINRKPPLPKGKRKGPGRGRKKKILAPTSAPGPAQVPTNEAVVGEQTPATNSLVGPKINLKTESSTNEDTEMGEDSQHPSDDEGDEGEEGEEGEIIESDDDSVDGNETATPTPAPEATNPSSCAGKSIPSSNPTAMKSVVSARPLPAVNDTLESASLPKEGSPLKVVQQAIKEEEKSPGVVEKKDERKITKEQQEETKPATMEPEQSQPISAPAPVTIPSEQITIPEPAPPATIPEPETSSIPSAPLQTPPPTQAPDEDEMLLDTIESSNLPAGDVDMVKTEEAGVKVDGGGQSDVGGDRDRGTASREVSREESEFPDLMGSLERHLEGNM